MLPPHYTLTHTLPTPADYCRLRTLAGMSAKALEAATRGLPNTLFAATVFHEGQLVGMGRVTGDGGLFFDINDIAVDPAHQKRGLGKAIVGALMDFVHRTAPATAHVTLIADGEAHRLYAHFGFKPVGPESIGMAIHIDDRRA